MVEARDGVRRHWPKKMQQPLWGRRGVEKKSGEIQKFFIPDAAVGYGDRRGRRVLKCKLDPMYSEGNRKNVECQMPSAEWKGKGRGVKGLGASRNECQMPMTTADCGRINDKSSSCNFVFFVDVVPVDRRDTARKKRARGCAMLRGSKPRLTRTARAAIPAIAASVSRQKA